jgi:hypothetical protein
VAHSGDVFFAGTQGLSDALLLRKAEETAAIALLQYEAGDTADAAQFSGGNDECTDGSAQSAATRKRRFKHIDNQ